ncbi:hypothetical protein KFL_001320040 [Klebsormidium nitens]|uniref:RRM domain-containing protein n=1 Tax=Klebsormidium nitens TaxID=105231 RepID=A0A1Y1I2M7_KLENI|nr:hypothetical protein KFL_001320040 [Klebsormidium nitens]|eukprot:GAQ82996.1 hypothetical protein KFL_001320040 [Klebsormidium nitens]
MALHALGRKHSLQLLELPFRPFLCRLLEAKALQTAGPSVPSHVRTAHQGTAVFHDAGSSVKKGHIVEFLAEDVVEAEGLSRDGNSCEGELGYARTASGAEASCSQSVAPKLASETLLSTLNYRKTDASLCFRSIRSPLPTGGGTCGMTSAPHLGSFQSRLGSARAYNMEQWANEETAGVQSRQAEGTCAYLKGAPHNALAGDMARYFAEFNVDESKVHPVYEENFRPHGWYIEFPSQQDFLNADRKTYDQTLGARAVRLEPRSRQYMEENIRRDEMQRWRGKAVVISHLPPDADEEALERFFHGYSIAGNGIKIFRHTLDRKPHEHDQEPHLEVRAVVKFTTGLEAMRAWREKHLDIVRRRSVRLTLVK